MKFRGTLHDASAVRRRGAESDEDIVWAVGVLVRQGKLRRGARAGMLCRAISDFPPFHGSMMWYRPADGGARHVPSAYHREDPATVGGLAAMAREATGKPLLYVLPEGDHEGHPDRWRVYNRKSHKLVAIGRTEFEAWAAVLIRAAENL